MIGTLKGAARDIVSGKWSITFEIEGEPNIEDIKDQKLEITAQRYRKKRSLDANAYFHLLVGKIAAALHTSNTEIKNHLIRDYGQYEYINDRIPTYLVAPEYVDEMLKREDIHFKPEGYEGDRARLAVMRGSHTYNTKEMSILIDATVEEAKALGIETMPPEELRRLLEVCDARNK